MGRHRGQALRRLPPSDPSLRSAPSLQSRSRRNARAVRAVASFCRNAGPPVRGRVKAPLARAVVCGPRAKRRGAGGRRGPGSGRRRGRRRAVRWRWRRLRPRTAPGGSGCGCVPVTDPAAGPRPVRGPRSTPPERWRCKPEDAPFLVRLDGHSRAEEADDTGPGEGEQLVQPGSRWAGREVAEEAVPPAADVAEPHQLPVDGEQSEEDGEVLAVRGVVTAVEVGADVLAQPDLECVVRRVAHAVQRVVERFEVEPVGRVGHGGDDEGAQLLAARVGGRVLLLEDLPVDGRALGMGGEEPVVVGVSELLVDKWPHIAPKVERTGLTSSSSVRSGPRKRGSGGRFALLTVADLGVVRDTAPRSDVQNGLLAGGQVLAVLVPPPRPSVSSTIRSMKASPKPRTMTGSPAGRAVRSLSAVKSGGR